MKSSMWKILLSLAMLGNVMGLLSCNPAKRKDQVPKKIFKYNENAGISSTDPAYAKDQSNIWCVNHLYNGLVQLDENLNIQPCIARNWSISSDGLDYTFNLRDDIYFIEDECFKSKRKLLAKDIVYTFNRLLDPNVASPGAWIFRDRVDKHLAFEAINDTIFVLHLARPFPPMLSILSMQYTFIVAQEAVEFYGRQFAYHPVGTGPFKLKIWEEGNAMYLIKNDSYFEQENGKRLPFIDGIKISFNENKKTELLEFKKGNLSFITDINVQSVADILDEQGALNQEMSAYSLLSKCPYLKTEYIGFNLQAQKPVDKRIRLAINLCFDRAKLIKYLRNNIGKEANAGMIPFGLPAYDTTAVKGYKYDPERARQLVKAVQKEHNLDIIVLYTNENYKEYALFIANEAAKIGLKLKVEVILPVLLREWMTQSKVDVFRASWIADYPEAESYMCLFYSKNSAPPNYTRYHNKAFDALYEQALLENDIPSRNRLYQQMENLISEESPVIPLYYDEVLRIHQKNIQNLKANAMNLLDLKRVQME